MDKLAKALEKARAQRHEALGTQRRRPSPTSGVAEEDLQPTHLNSDNTVTISEAMLEKNRIIAHRTRDKKADMFRILRTQVLQKMQANGMKTLGITSPNYGDGKTTVALNLALSIAHDMNQTVLLVDLDLRKPNVAQYLGLRPPGGLSDYFVDNVPIADCLIRLSFQRLSILPAGRMLDNSSEVLGSPKIAALAEELKARYPDRIIIYDLPPILAQDDPMVFLPHIDGLLLVVNEGGTRTQDLKSSLNALSSAHVLGTVLNNSEMSRARRKPASRTPLPGLQPV